MKKKIVFMVCLCMAVAGQAKVLRVNNVAGMAPYQQIQDAVNAASDGDTIMVDGAVEPYKEAIIDKQLVIVGPGYFLTENGIVKANNRAAKVNGMRIEKAGVTIMGMSFNTMYKFTIKAPKTVVTRCYFDNSTSPSIAEGADNCVFHQNYFFYESVGCNDSNNHQFTNNIFQRGYVNNLRNSYIGYNTFCLNEAISTWRDDGNTFEKNIVSGWEASNWLSSNTFIDNYIFSSGAFMDGRAYPENDKQVLERTNALTATATGYGAFSGNDPYQLSGIPAGPIIEQLTVPASVEEGSPLNVTIKLGLQK